MKRHLMMVAGTVSCMTASAWAQCESACTSEKSSANVALASFSADKDIVDTAVAAGNFTTLAKALEAADLVDALKGKGPFTVFAPTDEAFAKLPEGTVEKLLKPENKKMLQAVLTYHVVKGEAMAKDVLKKENWTTLNGQRIDISMKREKPYVDGAQIVATDIDASNGVIHVIDTVMMPETKNIVQVADSAGSFSTLLAAAKAAGLAETLMGEGPYTVFAPTDEAFSKLGQGTINDLLKPENRDQLKSILLYHVVPGRVYSDQAAKVRKAETVQGGEVMFSKGSSGLQVNKASIVNADIEASNGVIHVIDTVILPK